MRGPYSRQRLAEVNLQRKQLNSIRQAKNKDELDDIAKDLSIHPKGPARDKIQKLIDERKESMDAEAMYKIGLAHRRVRKMIDRGKGIL